MGDQPDTPTAEPRVDLTGFRVADPARARAMLRWPATALILLSAASVALDVAVLGAALLRDAPRMMEEHGRSSGPWMIAANVVGNGALFFVHASILILSVNMRRVRGYSRALAASVLSLIPICSPVLILGMPFGAWALVVLLRPEVVRAFVEKAPSSPRRRPHRGPDDEFF